MRLKQRLMPVLLTAAVLTAAPMAFAQNRGSSESSFSLRNLFGAGVPPVIRAQNGMPTLVGPNGLLPGSGGMSTGTQYDPTAVEAVPAQAGWNPYPGTDLFGERFRRFENQDGLWQYETRNDPRQYFSSIGAMFFRLNQPPRSLFGDDGSFIASQTSGIGGGRSIVRLGSAQADGDTSLNHPFKTEGIRLSWGFWDTDKTGLEVTTWWASEIREAYALNQTFNPTSIPTTQTTGPFIPANNGAGGGAVFADGEFELGYTQTAANIQFNRIMQPLWSWNDAIFLHPMWGARYTFLHERMSMDGYDFVAATPAASPLNLNSAVTSHMAGPSIGLYYSIGGDLLKFTFNTNLILYVNHQRERLDGYGFDDDLNGVTPIGGKFDDRQNRTHFSPGFEQTVHAEIPVFSWIPFINDLSFFKNARLKGGVTFLGIAEMARPNRTVDFRMAPLLPRLDDRRDKWSFIAYDAQLMFVY